MKPKGLFILDERSLSLLYGTAELEQIRQLVNLYAPRQDANVAYESPEVLSEAELILSGWNGPTIDEALLDAAPRLKAVFYGGGGAGSVLTPLVWERGVVVTSAYAANAIPVAEYTLAMILLSLKHVWTLSASMRATQSMPPRDGAPGSYGSTVGLVSYGMIARTLRRLLKPFDLNVLVYDPYLGEAEAASCDVRSVSIDELFRRSDVVSVHTAMLPETEGLIRGSLLRSMKHGATFINTARGELVHEDELIQVLVERRDLHAILDVTRVEPPARGSKLYALPNVMLTPHVAGSVGPECRRMGRYMVEELKRFLTGQPLRWSVTPELAANTCHRPVPRVTLHKTKLAAAAAKAAAPSAAALR